MMIEREEAKAEVIGLKLDNIEAFEDVALKAFDSISERIYQYYNRTLDSIDNSMDVGRHFQSVGLFSLDLLYELLHGGDYRWNINAANIPSFIAANGSPSSAETSSKYFTGVTQQKWSENLGAGGIIGPGADGYIATMIDANVPRVLPKLISDRTFAEWKLAKSQFLTTDLFASVISASSNLATLFQKGAEVAKQATEFTKSGT